jgi:hypothetical protein
MRKLDAPLVVCEPVLAESFLEAGSGLASHLDPIDALRYEVG